MEQRRRLEEWYPSSYLPLVHDHPRMVSMRAEGFLSWMSWHKGCVAAVRWNFRGLGYSLVAKSVLH